MAVVKKDYLDKILTYVDSPFKLMALVIMAVLAFMGFLIYKNLDLIVGTYKEQQRLPTMAENRLDDAVSYLFKYTQAEIVAVFKVDPMLGSRVLHRAYSRDGRNRKMEGIDVGLFSGNVDNNRDVVALMASEIPCSDYLRPQSEIGIWYMEQGVRFSCRISIPPDEHRFIGQMTVGWRERPTDLDYARTMLNISASMLSQSRK
jgi:hypothetical protein